MRVSPGKIDETERRFSPEEKVIAEILANEGKHVRAKAELKHKRSADSEVDGVLVEFKSFTIKTADSGTVRNTINHSIRRGGQARHIIIDARTSGLTKVEAVRGLIRARNLTRGMIDSVRIIGDAFDLVSTDFR